MSTVAPDAAAAATTAERLRITEIFLSLQGEARDAGWPSVFVRLTGCPLRCGYCDTAARVASAADCCSIPYWVRPSLSMASGALSCAG